MGMEFCVNFQTPNVSSLIIPSVNLRSWSPPLLFSRNLYKKVTTLRQIDVGLKSVQWNERRRRRVGRANEVVVSVGPTTLWDGWKPEKAASSPSLSDVFWPSAGAFAAMAIFGKIDQILSPKGISMTVAPLGAVCAILFTTPASPGARKYNMFMAQIGCAAIGVLALSIFGSGWLARSAALAASVAFMIYTRSSHPPAASLPIMFIDAAKFHRLNFWYVLFPGAAGCLLLCLLQEIVCYLKENVRF